MKLSKLNLFKRWTSTAPPHQCFGVGLHKLHAREQSEVPKVVMRLVEHIEKSGLEKEGLFRIAGNHRVIRQLKDNFNKEGDAELETNNITAACSLLKLFLRDLPVSIIPPDVQRRLEKLDHDQDHAEQIRSIIEEMPAVNIPTLRYLINFMVKVTENSATNKMDVTNMATIFGPCLFKIGTQSVDQQQKLNQLVETMLRQSAYIFAPREDINQSSEQALKETQSEKEKLEKEMKDYKLLLELKEKEIELKNEIIKLKEEQMEAEKKKLEGVIDQKDKLLTEKDDRIISYKKQLAEKNAIIVSGRRPAKDRRLTTNLAQYTLAVHCGDIDAQHAISGMMRRYF